MSKKHKVIRIFSICVPVIAILYVALELVIGYSLYSDNTDSVTNQRTSDQVLVDWLVNDKGYDVDAFKSKYNVEEISIHSSTGDHSIPASYIYGTVENDRSASTIIMVHGLYGNRISNYPVAEMFLEMGWNVITYDQRSSGGNTAPHTTFGYLESLDLVDYTAYAAENVAEGNHIAVWGQSMGSATVQNAMDDEFFASEVDMVILDCPMGDMKSIIGAKGISGVFSDMLLKKNLGFGYDDQSVYHQIRDTDIPVLIVGSKADERIPYAVAESIFETIQNENKYIFYVEDSAHSDIYFDHPEEYRKAVKEFISDNLINE